MSLIICLLGDAKTGKSHFVKKLIDDEDPIYNSTVGCQKTVHCLNNKDFFNESLNITLIDTGGYENFAGLGEGYYVGSDLAIIFYNKSKISRKIAIEYKKKYKRVCDDNPIVFVFVGKEEDLVKISDTYYSINLDKCSTKDANNFLSEIIYDNNLFKKSKNNNLIIELIERKKYLLEELDKVNKQLDDLIENK